MYFSFDDVIAARERIAPYIKHTPLLRAEALDDLLGCKVYLKPEGFQRIGAYKLRGATNFMLSLTHEQRAAGVAASSSGNHALGVAAIAKTLGVHAVILMPSNSNPVKLEGVRALGAEVVFTDGNSDERARALEELAAERNCSLVHACCDPFVAAGQGTIGLEIIEDNPDIDVVVVPIGGGGLISGIATAVKELKPECRIIGAEPTGCARYAASRRAGHAVRLENPDKKTIADGTRRDVALAPNFMVIEKYVDTLVNVEDEWIYKAIKEIATKGRIIAEPSAVLGIAAALAGRLQVRRDENVCFVLSGANIDKRILIKALSE